MNYQAKLKVPFGVLGIRCTGDALTGIDFLPPSEKPQRATSEFAKTVCEQLLHYLENPDAQFSVPLELNGTLHQQKVWQAMLDIPRGQTRSYGEIAAELKSCAQAVGQACGANSAPIIVPCHRVVGKAGLGGFAHHTSGTHLDIKRWLLAHESTTPSPPAPDRTTSHSTKPAGGQVAGYLPKGARGEFKAPSPLQGEGWVTNDLAVVVGRPSQMASSSIREGRNVESRSSGRAKAK